MHNKYFSIIIIFYKGVKMGEKEMDVMLIAKTVVFFPPITTFQSAHLR